MPCLSVCPYKVYIISIKGKRAPGERARIEARLKVKSCFLTGQPAGIGIHVGLDHKLGFSKLHQTLPRLFLCALVLELSRTMRQLGVLNYTRSLYGTK